MAVSRRNMLVNAETTVAQNTDMMGEKPIIMKTTIEMSEKKWKALPPADQKLVSEAFEAGGQAATTALLALESRLVGELKGKGMTVVDSDRDSFRAAMKPVYAKNEAVWGKGVLEMLQAMK